MNHDEIQEEADSIMRSGKAKLELEKISKSLGEATSQIEAKIKSNEDLEDVANDVEKIKNEIEELEADIDVIERDNVILDVANRWVEKGKSE